jgi:hypothetical protein
MASHKHVSSLLRPFFHRSPLERHVTSFSLPSFVLDFASLVAEQELAEITTSILVSNNNALTPYFQRDFMVHTIFVGVMNMFLRVILNLKIRLFLEWILGGLILSDCNLFDVMIQRSVVC